MPLDQPPEKAWIRHPASQCDWDTVTLVTLVRTGDCVGRRMLPRQAAFVHDPLACGESNSGQKSDLEEVSLGRVVAYP